MKSKTKKRRPERYLFLTNYSFAKESHYVEIIETVVDAGAFLREF